MEYNPEIFKGQNLRELMEESEFHSIGILLEAYSSRESVRDFLQKKASELTESRFMYGSSGFLPDSQDVMILENETDRMFYFVISGDLLKSRKSEDWRQYGNALRKEIEGINAWEKDNMYWPSEEEFKDLKDKKRI